MKRYAGFAEIKREIGQNAGLLVCEGCHELLVYFITWLQFGLPEHVSEFYFLVCCLTFIYYST